MPDSKKVSLLVGIYNCADTLAQCIESVLAQTYTNFELILCDDCSRDNTYEIAKSYAEQDNRIVLIKNSENIKLGRTLNHCLSVATGEYCARLDGDDYCAPDRLEKQVAFLDTHPEFDCVGTYMRIVDGSDSIKIRKVPEFPPVSFLAQSNPCCHATMMMRTEVLRSINGYDVRPETERIEDVDMFWRFYLSGHKAANILEPLYFVREDPDTYKRRKMRFDISCAGYRYNACKKAGLGFRYRILAGRQLITAIMPHSIVRLYHSIKDQRKD